MNNPRIIEYLLTVEKPGGGGYLVNEGMNQVEIPICPPNTEISYNVWPYEGDFADIFFYAVLDPAVLPRVFFLEGQYFGSKTYAGIMTQAHSLHPMGIFTMITQSEPAYARLRNQSPLNQYFCFNTFFLCIPSESDFSLVKEKVREMASSGDSLELQEEANRLLKVLAGEPQPPLGGS
jgi:hypothetical protein